ncbi:MAG TPA: alpha/beta fold hydrolase [Candidatus Dormibacteraeota bacterium]|nr:alpha/beta fold hydrolase [Candidatus Dormibacteraeota bacterium]
MFDTLLARGEHLAEVEAQRAVLRFLNGVDWLLRDPSHLVGRTPYDVVFQRGKVQLRRYHHADRSLRPRHDLPVLCIPPLMVKPFIFDLVPERSLLKFLLDQGFDVFLVDFGEPDSADALVTLDDYVLDWIPTAVAAVREASGSRELSLLGYCMGGLFALMYLGATPDRSVRNVVTIGAPLDANKMGLFAWTSKMAGGQVEFLARRMGNIPGGLSSAVFRLLTPAKNLTRYADLFMNLWDREYVNGFDAMNQWVRQFIDYPQGAFLQFTRDFMQHNRLVRGTMRFGDKVADLRRVRANLLVFAGKTDQIAPAAAVRAQLDAVASADTTYRVAPGGHMGVFAGQGAPRHVWQPTAAWLAARSAARPTRPRAASAKSPARRATRGPRRSGRAAHH